MDRSKKIIQQLWNFDSPTEISKAIKDAIARRNGFTDPLTRRRVSGDGEDFLTKLLEHLLREAAGQEKSVWKFSPNDQVLAGALCPIIQAFYNVCSDNQRHVIHDLIVEVMNSLLRQGCQVMSQITSPKNKLELAPFFLGCWFDVFRVQFPKNGNRLVKVDVV